MIKNHKNYFIVFINLFFLRFFSIHFLVSLVSNEAVKIEKKCFCIIFLFHQKMRPIDEQLISAFLFSKSFFSFLFLKEKFVNLDNKKFCTEGHEKGQTEKKYKIPHFYIKHLFYLSFITLKIICNFKLLLHVFVIIISYTKKFKSDKTIIAQRIKQQST